MISVQSIELCSISRSGQRVKDFLTPYVYIVLTTAASHFIVHYLFFNPTARLSSWRKGHHPKFLKLIVVRCDEVNLFLYISAPAITDRSLKVCNKDRDISIEGEVPGMQNTYELKSRHHSSES